MTTVPVKQHVRRRTGKTARISTALGYGTDVKVGPYVRRRLAAPHWTQSSTIPGREEYRGQYKGIRLYVGRAANDTWYWSVRKGGKDGFFKDSIDFIKAGGPQSQSPGEAARRAEHAAGYEYAGEVIRAGMAFQDPTERTE